VLNPPPKRCATCGADNLPLAPRCASCGQDFLGQAAVAPPPANTDAPAGAYCATCGAKLVAGAAFCSTCGTVTGAVPGKASPRVDRPGVIIPPVALAGGALAVLLVAVAVVAFGSLSGGQRGASDPSPAPSVAVTAAPSAPPADTFAATACRLTDDLTTAQNEHVVPLAGMLGDWVAGLSIPVGQDARDRARAHATAVAQILSRNASTVGSLRSAANPELVVDIVKAYEGYAAGLQTLAPIFQNSNTADSLTQIVSGTQQLNAAKTALDDANSKLDLMMAAGTANCS
jgi:hypothetical protein